MISENGAWEHHTILEVITYRDGSYHIACDGFGFELPPGKGADPQVGDRISLYVQHGTAIVRCVLGEREVPTYYALKRGLWQ